MNDMDKLLKIFPDHSTNRTSCERSWTSASFNIDPAPIGDVLANYPEGSPIRMCSCFRYFSSHVIEFVP